MLVMICGSRRYDDADTMRSALAELPPGSRLLASDAAGADRLAFELAEELGLEVEVLPVLWTTHGRKAGILCTLALLSREPDEVWAFWDGQSSGTRSAIELARKQGRRLRLWTPAGAEVEDSVPRLPGL